MHIVRGPFFTLQTAALGCRVEAPRPSALSLFPSLQAGVTFLPPNLHFLLLSQMDPISRESCIKCIFSLLFH